MPTGNLSVKTLNWKRKYWCPGADLNHRHADFQSEQPAYGATFVTVILLPTCSLDSDVKRRLTITN